MEYMYELKDKLCKELDEIANKPDMSAGDLEAAHKLSDTIKNLDKIEMLEEGDYSQSGDWDDMRSSYGRGNSYANRGQHYVRGHYSRERRDSRGRYSRDGSYSRNGGYSQARDEIMDRMGEMMTDADSKEREILKRAMRELENA